MTGLIYVAIIAVWAAVLVPMWLRRQDHANEHRTVERFNSAMHTLNRSRRHGDRDSAGVVPAGREIVQPRPASRPDVVVPGARRRVSARPSASEIRRERELARGSARTPARGRGEGPATARTAARRRRTLLLLVVLLVATVAGVVAGLLPVPVVALPIALLAVFGLVASGSGTAAATASAAADRSEPATRGRYADAAYRDRPADADRYRPRRSPVGAGGLPDPYPAEVPQRARRRIDREPLPEVAALAPTGTDGWAPMPTTLPTYVNAPRATGIPRILDLTTPGSWTSAAMLEHAQHMRTARDLHAEQEAALAEDYDAAVADLADPGSTRRRRVVGG